MTRRSKTNYTARQQADIWLGHTLSFLGGLAAGAGFLGVVASTALDIAGTELTDKGKGVKMKSGEFWKIAAENAGMALGGAVLGLAGKGAKDFFSTKGVGGVAKKAEGGITKKAEVGIASKVAGKESESPLLEDHFHGAGRETTTSTSSVIAEPGIGEHSSLTKPSSKDSFVMAHYSRQQMIERAKTGINPDNLSAPVHNLYKYIYHPEVSGIHSKELVVASKQLVEKTGFTSSVVKGGKGSLLENDKKYMDLLDKCLRDGTIKDVDGKPLVNTDDFMDAVRRQRISKSNFESAMSKLGGVSRQVTSGGVGTQILRIQLAIQRGDLLPEDFKFLKQLAGNSITVLTNVPAPWLGLV